MQVVFSQTRNFTVIAFTDANMYATSMARRKGRFWTSNGATQSDGSGSKGLTPCTCLCYRCCPLEQGTYRRALKGAKQSARPRGPLLLKIAPREMKHALKIHVPVYLYVLYRIRILCTVLYDVPINVAYKTLSKYFIQVLSFVILVHITQTATRVGPN